MWVKQTGKYLNNRINGYHRANMAESKVKILNATIYLDLHHL